MAKETYIRFRTTVEEKKQAELAASVDKKSLSEFVRESMNNKAKRLLGAKK